MMITSNLPLLIETVGYIGLGSIVFAESGLFFGFFLPGDSLLFTAGILASQGHLDIALVIVISVIAAIVGDSVGYAFGSYVGPKLFKKSDSLFFHREHVIKAQTFYEKHGRKTLILARFIPIVRTFAPILAGVAKMNYRVFLTYNIIGGLIWAVGLPLAGYFLGSAIPNIDQYLLPVILGIILASFVPIIMEYLKARRHR